MTTSRVDLPRAFREHGLWYLILVGLAVSIPGWVMVVDKIAFAAQSVPATATVVGSTYYRASGRSSCAGWTYSPRVSFTTRTGRHVTTVLPHTKSCQVPTLNTTIKIAYETNDPTNAAQRRQFAVWAVPIVLAGSGTWFVIVGIGSYVSAHRKNRVARERMAHL